MLNDFDFPFSCIYVGCAPSHEGRGYIRAPGIYTDAHVEGWKIVNDAVHAKGGFIFCQLMHAGRVSHSSLLPNNMLPLAPSAVKMEGLIHTPSGKVTSTVHQLTCYSSFAICLLIY